MQQVIMNLIANAIDAMKDSVKKELTVCVEFIENNLRMVVKDTGSGIHEETLDKIFEPFFTTKNVGQGTGLGLSVSKGIVEEHQGTLTCQTKLGTGTIFIVTLPRDLKAG